MDAAADPTGMNQQAGILANSAAAPLPGVEHALGMLRTHLIEFATQDDWGEHRAAQLMDVIRACIGHPRGVTNEGLPADARLPRRVLRQIVRFVNGHLDSKLKWDDIAAEVKMDPFALARRFKLSTGLTVRQYVIRSRLRHATSLLRHSHLGLSEIALQVGFSCQSHMTTLFRKHLGTTPGAFRASVARA